MSKHYGQLIANNQMAIAEQLQRIEDLQKQRKTLTAKSTEYKAVTQQIAKCRKQISFHEHAIASLMEELRSNPAFHELPRTVA